MWVCLRYTHILLLFDFMLQIILWWQWIFSTDEKKRNVVWWEKKMCVCVSFVIVVIFVHNFRVRGWWCLRLCRKKNFIIYILSFIDIYSSSSSSSTLTHQVIDMSSSCMMTHTHTPNLYLFMTCHNDCIRNNR